MIKPYQFFVAFALLFISLKGVSQPFQTGMDFNDQEYSQLPVTAPLTRGDFDNLPSSISLQKYAPTPGNQGQTGTCVAWSSAYHARTIAESIRSNRTMKSETDKNTFSPTFIYNQIRLENGCEKGTYLNQALELMKNQGVAKYNDLQFDCNHTVNSADKQHAAPYKIKDYKTLFLQDGNNKILPVKKSLAEKKPVLIGMLCPESFYYAKDVWQPKQEEYGKPFGGHAMVTIGYDDNKYGGAFLIMNSWGTQWGNGGFIWIKYSDYNEFVKYAFEMIESLPNEKILAGAMNLSLKEGGSMKISYNASKGVYSSSVPYPSGTQFRLYIANNEPAYVYALGSDSSKKSFDIFPHEKNISPFLGYKGNNVAIPSEKHWVRMDQNTGIDYFCVLYSSSSLDIDQIKRDLERAPGNSFVERLNYVLKDKLVRKNKIIYSTNNISFKGGFSGEGIIPIVVEIEHI